MWGYGIGEIISWQCPADDIYYVLVKQYESTDFGQNTEYDLRVYHPTGAGAGIIKGIVVDTSGNGISGAIIKSDLINATAITLPDGYYIMFLPSGTYNITVMIEGYASPSQSEVVVSEESTATLNILIPSPFDIDGDHDLDLADVILVLRVLSREGTSGQVRSDYAISSADVNGDDKVGMKMSFISYKKFLAHDNYSTRLRHIFLYPIRAYNKKDILFLSLIFGFD